MPALAQVGRLLTFIRFSHTVFALPFALGSMFVAARGLPGARTFLLVVLAMVFARTAAMTFNRLADWEIDMRNPRTSGRHRLVTRPAARALLATATIAFITTAWLINPLCFLLSPAAIAIVFLYSLTKRFTDFTHFFLGLALAIAPVGAWLAVTGAFALPPIVLALAVLAWVAGFDLIYATQDAGFDRVENLKSLVVRLGIPRSLKLARILHLAMLALLAAFGFAARLGPVYFGSLVLVAGALLYEHSSLKSPDIAAINRAFFNSNAFVGLVFVTATLADLLLTA